MPDDRIAIREFTPSDLAGVVALMLELQRFERQFADDHATPDQAFGQWYVDRLLGILREHDGVLLVATRNGAVCGFSAGFVEDDPEARSRCFYIAELSVTERLRSHGIGLQLVRALEDAARARGLATVVIGVLAKSTRVHEFYNRLGFHDHAIRLRKKLQSTRT